MKKTSKVTRAYFLKIKRRAAAVTIAVMTFFIVLSCVAVYGNSTDNIQNTQTDRNHKYSTQATDYFNQIAYMCMLISRSPTVPEEQLDPTSKYLTNQILAKTIGSYVVCFDFLSGISINTGSATLSSGSVTEKPMTEIGMYKSCTVLFSSDNMWPFILRFRYQSPVIDGYDVSIDVSVFTLSQMIFKDSGQLITDTGTILLSFNQDDYGKPIHSVYPLSVERLIENFDSSSYYMNYEPLGNSAFGTLVIVKKSNYFAQQALLLLIVLLIGMILTILIFLTTATTIKNIYQPIGEIVNTFKYHFPENPQPLEDEIAYINRCILETIQSKSELEQQMPEVLVKVKKAQAYALHSQINPHFLSNTLDNIKWMSIESLGINNDIEQCLILLDKLLHESMNQSEITTTLRHEIELTTIYISLMKICFLDRFDVVWDVDPSLLDCIILKFTIQPLIENAIQHGFTQKRKDQLISIRIVEHNKNLNIHITDNGSGIPADKLTQIRHSLENIEEESGHQIGMRNIHAKTNLIFGKDYGIQVLESSPKGTHIEMILPSKKKHL